MDTIIPISQSEEVLRIIKLNCENRYSRPNHPGEYPYIKGLLKHNRLLNLYMTNKLAFGKEATFKMSAQKAKTCKELIAAAEKLHATS